MVRLPANGTLSTPKGELIGYARVSTEDQSLRLQIDALKKAGCSQIYEERKSGASSRRPELDLAIKELRPGDTLVVWRIDRLARSGGELYRRLGHIEQAGAGFRSLQENFDFSTATGRFVLGILGLVAEMERQLTIERTRAGMEALRIRGKPLGRAREFTDAKQAKALKLVRSGMAVERAVKAVGVSKATFYGYYRVTRKGKRVIVTKRKK